MTDPHNDRPSPRASGEHDHASLPATPSLPWAVAAVWGAFLHEGLMLTSHNVERTLALLNRWGDTTLALIQAVCEYLPTLWEEVQPFYSSLPGTPGVFEYEVVSQLGEEIASHLLEEGRLPSQAVFAQMARASISAFYLNRQDAGDRRPPSSGQSGVRPPRTPSLHRRWLRAIERFFGGTS